MAYQLKYYKDIESQGHDWRLEIYQETDNVLTAVEIGPVVQGLRLIVQGDQADIDTPIVKTSLEMVFVDADDLDDPRKCGYWEEFYTSSATEYKVSLIKDGHIEWSGYVTPDSFSESLQYRGSVTIIARDNLGALQDFEYDLLPDSTGMVSMMSLINKAMNAISFPMEYDIVNLGARRFIKTYDTSVPTEIYETLYNSKAFQNKTWLEVIESVLLSTGLVLRYVGGNYFMLASIRDIPLYDAVFWWNVPLLEAEFCAYGQRELSPAAKTIVDEVNFEIEENIAEIDMPAETYGDESSFSFYRLMAQSGTSSNPIQIIPVHAITGGTMEKRIASESLAFDPFRYPIKEGRASRSLGEIHDPSKVYIAANGGTREEDDIKDVEYRLLIGPGTYNIEFTLGNPIALYDDMTSIGHIDVEMKLSQLKVLLNYQSVDGAVTKRYDVNANVWVSGIASRENTAYIYLSQSFPYTYSFEPLTVEANGYISITITRVSANQQQVVKAESSGMYIPLQDIKVKDKSLETMHIPGKLKVTTKYNDKNNIILQRKPEFGFNSANVASPKIIRNGIYIYKDLWYEPSELWKFELSDKGQSMLVLVHQQLLAYYSKPNNVLTGELATPNPLFNALYEWQGKKHILTSGALNVITGRMENVVLREFMRYDHMWETWINEDDEDIVIDYPETNSLVLRARSNRALSRDDVTNLPLWLSLRAIHSRGQGEYNIILRAMANASGQERSAIFKVDTAYVRVTQRAAGDYGIDYGKDYS